MAKQPMGLGTPDPIGATPPLDNEPDGDEMGSGGAKLDADTVKYHPDARNCGNCEHNQGGSCEVIGESVSDEGGCMVWEGHDADDTMGGPPMGAPPPMPMGPPR